MSVQRSIPARPFTMGNMSLLRVLPHVNQKMVGPFIFMDQGGPLTLQKKLSEGIPEHPHAGLSTFTYLIEGSVLHHDSTGFRAHVRSGDVALMTAGSGVSHEETPIFEHNSTTHSMYFAQMWLALPDEAEDMAPTFEHHLAESIPIFERNGATVRIAMGTMWGIKSPTTCYATTFFADIVMQASGKLELQDTYKEQALFILEGNASLNGIPLSKHTLYIVDADTEILVSETGCRALYFGGAPFPSKRYISGSFVASSKVKLQTWMKKSQTPTWPRIQR